MEKTPTNIASIAHQHSIGMGTLIAITPKSLLVQFNQRELDIPFTRCCSSLLSVQLHDRVLLQPVTDEWVIVGRLMRKDERPLPIEYNADGGLNIGTSNGQLEITTEGDIRINGKQIVVQGQEVEIEAHHQAHLKGKDIRLG